MLSSWFESKEMEVEEDGLVAYSEENGGGQHGDGGGNNGAGEPPYHEAIEGTRGRETEDKSGGVEDRNVEDGHGRACRHRQRSRHGAGRRRLSAERILRRRHHRQEGQSTRQREGIGES